ncbi:MAG: acyl--CoA ligase, partial [Sandaracinaceae bacterium]|nr:acyl--CoA ligase [Sandaracinaceae bacterium]
MNANNNANTRPFSLCPAWEGQVCPNRTGAEFWRDIVHLGLAMGSASPGKALALLCEDRYLFACAWLGALAQGFRVVLPWSTQTEAIREIRKEVSLVLHDRDELRGWDLRKLIQGAKAIDPGDPVAARFRDRLAAIDPSTVLAVIYTSGTTGEARPYPKNAMQLLGEARLLAKEFGIQPSDRLLSTVPSHHIYGLLFGILLPLSAGASFVPRAGFYPEAIAELQRSVQASVLVSVPAHLRALALS